MDLGELTGVLAVVGIFIMPMFIGLVSILLKHQRNMAELVRGQQQGGSQEMDDLRREMQELKDIVTNQALNIDDLQRRIDMSEQRVMGERWTKA